MLSKHMGFLRHIIGLVIALLLSALSAVAMPMMPTASDHAQFFLHQRAFIAKHTDAHFTARAPPLVSANVAFTGAAVAEHGNVVVMHAHETHVASLGFVAGFDAPNRTVSRTDFDQRFNGKFSSQAEADEAFKQYEIAKNADSEIVLGRLPDTEAGSQLGMTRLDSGNWTPNVNDSFIQGGIDAGKPFYLGSNPDISNYRAAWNALEGNRGNYPQTVFFREMKQLRDAGYRLVGDNMLPPN